MFFVSQLTGCGNAAKPNTVHLSVAQAVKPAEPRFISAFLAALDQGQSSASATSPAFTGFSMYPSMRFDSRLRSSNRFASRAV